MNKTTPFTQSPSSFSHDLQARIYVADTDFSGVVYHARYLEFLERGRSEFLRDMGLSNNELISDSQGEKLFFVVRHMDITFSKPATLDDLLTIKTSLQHVQGARFFMNQIILRDEIILIKAKVEIALINQEAKPRRLPKNLFSSALLKSDIGSEVLKG
ncbi:tol-pal system-associated acyl-CoA thioesterase [Bartonella bilalgolemii]|uniref:Tol-pal system-associated acyl-CoA thioesterase n=1 Tax=Bartonella bilalgolemii TaxID=2942911 RepID=A0ABT0P772_9HYPH|nr:tol-pal system-associated acyl-CoA thioesterase [Bartonella sp. G70]MCL6229194.1 tol-pal system-associated acyl-CoA thioesterase [Bartonella sp. G70]